MQTSVLGGLLVLKGAIQGLIDCCCPMTPKASNCLSRMLGAHRMLNFYPRTMSQPLTRRGADEHNLCYAKYEFHLVEELALRPKFVGVLLEGHGASRGDVVHVATHLRHAGLDNRPDGEGTLQLAYPQIGSEQEVLPPRAEWERELVRREGRGENYNWRSSS